MKFTSNNSECILANYKEFNSENSEHKKAFINYIRDAQITSIDFKGCTIDNNFLKDIIEALNTNPLITKLNFTQIATNIESAKLLSNMLNNNKNIENLDISMNSKLTLEGVKLILDAGIFLKALNLQMCKLDNDLIPSLCDFITSNKFLNILDLYGNEINDAWKLSDTILSCQHQNITKVSLGGQWGWHTNKTTKAIKEYITHRDLDNKFNNSLLSKSFDVSFDCVINYNETNSCTLQGDGNFLLSEF